MMFNIIMLLMAATMIVVGAARKRRRFRRYLRGNINLDIALSTLVGNSGVSKDASDNVQEKAWLSSVKLSWAMDDLTDAAGEGPVLCGVAHSDYLLAEIEEWIENTGSWSEGDLPAQEIARRKIRQVGIFNSEVGNLGTVVLNDGRPITTKCGWVLQSGETVRMWWYNTGGNTLTNGAIGHVNGHANLWPM